MGTEEGSKKNLGGERTIFGIMQFVAKIVKISALLNLYEVLIHKSAIWLHSIIPRIMIR